MRGCIFNRQWSVVNCPISPLYALSIPPMVSLIPPTDFTIAINQPPTSESCIFAALLPMPQHNFYKIDLIHKVTADFVKDHENAVRRWMEGVGYLETLEEKLKEQPKKGASHWPLLHNFHQELTDIHSNLKTAYDNLHISYHAFHTTAQQDEKVHNEFKKVPSDFAKLQNALSEVLGGYELALQQLRETI